MTNVERTNGQFDFFARCMHFFYLCLHCLFFSPFWIFRISSRGFLSVLRPQRTTLTSGSRRSLPTGLHRVAQREDDAVGCHHTPPHFQGPSRPPPWRGRTWRRMARRFRPPRRRTVVHRKRGPSEGWTSSPVGRFVSYFCLWGLGARRIGEAPKCIPPKCFWTALDEDILGLFEELHTQGFKNWSIDHLVGRLVNRSRPIGHVELCPQCRQSFPENLPGNG